jgi:hypothetical protein
MCKIVIFFFFGKTHNEDELNVLSFKICWQCKINEMNVILLFNIAYKWTSRHLTIYKKIELVNYYELFSVEFYRSEFKTLLVMLSVYKESKNCGDRVNLIHDPKLQNVINN